MKIGDIIKQKRKEHKISQRDLAKQLDIPFSTLANYENNHREPNLETIAKIAAALRTSISELIPSPPNNDTGLIYADGLESKISKIVMDNIKTKDPYYDLRGEALVSELFYPYNDLISAYNQLNDLGKEKTMEYINDLLEVDKYKEGE